MFLKNKKQKSVVSCQTHLSNFLCYGEQKIVFENEILGFQNYFSFKKEKKKDIKNVYIMTFCVMKQRKVFLTCSKTF